MSNTHDPAVFIAAQRASLALFVAAQVYGVPVEEMRRPTRGRPHVARGPPDRHPSGAQRIRPQPAAARRRVPPRPFHRASCLPPDRRHARRKRRIRFQASNGWNACCGGRRGWRHDQSICRLPRTAHRAGDCAGSQAGAAPPRRAAPGAAAAQGWKLRGGALAFGRVAASRLTVAGDIVTAFVREGWIAPDGPGRYILSEAGAAFVSRSQGGESRFADQHRLLEDRSIGAGEAARTVRINAGESPLARLKFRGLVDDVQFAAGEKLRRDFTLGQLTPRMGVDLSAPVMAGGGAHDNISDIAIAARQRFNRALAAVGPGAVRSAVRCLLSPGLAGKRGGAARLGQTVGPGGAEDRARPAGGALRAWASPPAAVPSAPGRRKRRVRCCAPYAA